MTKKNIELNDHIVSSSDISLNDIVEAVAKHLGCPKIDAKLKNAVGKAVGEATGCRGASVAGINGGTVTPGIKSVTVTRCGEGLGVSIERGGCEEPLYDAAYDLAYAPHNSTPKISGKSKWYGKVLQNGEVWTPYTNRRFLPAQYMRLMSEFDGNVSAGVSVRYSLQDVWSTLDNEISTLIWTARNWANAFAERSQFFTVDDCVKIMTEYLVELRKNINNRAMCDYSKTKRTYSRSIRGEGRVTLWTYDKTTDEGRAGALTTTESITPSEWLIRTNTRIEVALRRLGRCDTYEKALTVLRVHLPRVSMGTYRDSNGRVRNWLPKRWKECFIKAGAYYTLKALIVNKHVRLTTEDFRGTKTVSGTVRDGLDGLKAFLAGNVPCYVVHAVLKKSIEQAGFDVSAFLRRVSKR